MFVCLFLSNKVLFNKSMYFFIHNAISHLIDCMHAKLLHSCPAPYDTMDCSPPGTSVCGDSPGKNTEEGCHALQGIFPTQGSNPGLLYCRQIFYHLSHQGSPICNNAAAAAKSLQLCPTLCDPKDGSPPGSPVPGILQARTLEWGAISFSNA